MRTAVLLVLVLAALTPASALANPCGPVPQVLIVLDRSGSMMNPTGASKWTIAKQAVNNLTTKFTGQVDFGLMLFPRWPHVSNCSSGQVNVYIGPGTAGSIVTMLNNSKPYSNADTPISLSLDAARTALQSAKIGSRPQYVLLITDGKETCQPASTNNPPKAAGKLLSGGVKTYVVGFGSGVNPTSLTSTAQSGGTAKYYQADNLIQLEAALNVIAAAISCCGDGKLDPGELCDTKISWGAGACPTNCDDNNKCTTDVLTGWSCNAACVYTNVTTPKHGDGCCPLGANSATDSDCPPSCGNGVLDGGEKCDTKIPFGSSGACPINCNDNNSCTQDTMMGSGCQAYCTHKNTCPVNKCGNGKHDGREKCDTAIPWGKAGACPTKLVHCDDNNPNTKDFLTGSGCQAYCTHSSAATCGNGVVDAGEWCDTKIPYGQKGACPKNCNDNDKCTKDLLMGTACLAKCSNVPITGPKHGDGCCPSGATWQTDNDCPKNSLCGNGKLDPGEKCDPGISSGPGSCLKLCNDSNACTKDQLGGSKCNVKCFYTQVGVNPNKKDNCCPPGNSSDQDPDCPPPCGPDQKTKCVNLCAEKKCPDGHYCNYGKCVPWPKNPGTKNDAGPGTGNPGNPQDGMTGGCDCQVGGVGVGLPALLGLLALLWFGFRRRR